MKIEIIIRHSSGEGKRYLCHKIVKHEDIYIANYTTIKHGVHVCRGVEIDGKFARIEVIP